MNWYWIISDMEQKRSLIAAGVTAGMALDAYRAHAAQSGETIGERCAFYGPYLGEEMARQVLNALVEWNRKVFEKMANASPPPVSSN